jgi:DNA-directed RNA polymerase sigma subunit (sigma70/sigma32)
MRLTDYKDYQSDLPPDHPEKINENFYMTRGEVAELLGVKEHTIRKIEERALEKLSYRLQSVASELGYTIL